MNLTGFTMILFNIMSCCTLRQLDQFRNDQKKKGSKVKPRDENYY